MEQNENIKAEGNEVDEGELTALMEQNASLQSKEHADDAIKADYILLAKQGSKALNPKEKDLYIEGLKIGDFYIQKDSKNLGSDVKVVPLAFVPLYTEWDSPLSDAKAVGTWNKEQACQFPLVEDSYFNRQLPNGHILTPVNWVLVEVIGHPEIENAVISFKKTAIHTWKEWKEDTGKRSQSSATLVYRLISQEATNKAGQKWDEIGFEFDSSLLDSAEGKRTALLALKKSNGIREAVANCQFVPNRQISAPQATTAYIEDASETEDSDDTESIF